MCGSILWFLILFHFFILFNTVLDHTLNYSGLNIGFNHQLQAFSLNSFVLKTYLVNFCTFLIPRNLVLNFLTRSACKIVWKIHLSLVDVPKLTPLWIFHKFHKAPLTGFCPTTTMKWVAHRFFQLLHLALSPQFSGWCRFLLLNSTNDS